MKLALQKQKSSLISKTLCKIYFWFLSTRHYFNTPLYPPDSPFKNLATLAIVVEEAQVWCSIALYFSQAWSLLAISSLSENSTISSSVKRSLRKVKTAFGVFKLSNASWSGSEIFCKSLFSIAIYTNKYNIYYWFYTLLQ